MYDSMTTTFDKDCIWIFVIKLSLANIEEPRLEAQSCSIFYI